jgi:hypothetical protein
MVMFNNISYLTVGINNAPSKTCVPPEFAGKFGDFCHFPASIAIAEIFTKESAAFMFTPQTIQTLHNLRSG